MPRLRSSAVRYGVASCLALVSDFLLTLGLFQTTSLSLTWSAAIAFVLVGIGFYFVHEFWTFQRAGAGVSLERLKRNFLILCLAFLARVGAIGGLESWHPPDFFLGTVYFAAGAVLSFSINYAANRIFVFRQGET